MKRAVLFTGLALIVLANLLMMYYAPYGLVRRREGYQNATVEEPVEEEVVAETSVSANNTTANSTPANSNPANSAAPVNTAAAPVNAAALVNTPVEGFASYNVANAGGAKDVYQPIGQFDGVKLSTGNSVSSWRYTAPNEPLTGAEFVPGDDELFMFKNNQCKPECCGASFSCGGGCVCTTPKQRQYIAERGGNRTQPEDSV
jgi:hypothetical protein